MRGWLTGLVIASAAVACGKSDGKGDTGQAAAAKTAATGQASAAEQPGAGSAADKAAAAAKTAASAKTAGAGGGSGGASAVAMKLPPGRSAAPTIEEWDKQKREVTVKGSSALNCETKMVREYLRVSCRGKNDSGGTPRSIKVTKGGREAQVFATTSVISLILPVLEGTDFLAQFSWSDKSHPLSVKWVKGSKMPVVLGVFEGAKSPLDGGSSGLEAKLCECHKKIFKASSCDDLLGSPNEDCDRSFGGDCSMLLGCSRGEPGAWATCRPGWINGPPLGWCSQTCGAGKPACPAGQTCLSDFSEPICVAN